MADLDALSREIAATSDAWMVPGVEFFNSGDGEHGRVYMVEYGVVYCVTRRLRLAKYLTSAPIRPNLADPATVNSLLGAGSVWQSLICNEFTARIADAATFSPDRTEAICRAWIAANRGSK